MARTWVLISKHERLAGGQVALTFVPHDWYRNVEGTEDTEPAAPGDEGASSVRVVGELMMTLLRSEPAYFEVGQHHDLSLWPNRDAGLAEDQF